MWSGASVQAVPVAVNGSNGSVIVQVHAPLTALEAGDVEVELTLFGAHMVRRPRRARRGRCC